MNLTEQKTVYSSDPQVHIDIMQHSKDDWTLVKEVVESHDKIVLIFERTFRGN